MSLFGDEERDALPGSTPYFTAVALGRMRQLSPGLDHAGNTKGTFERRAGGRKTGRQRGSPSSAGAAVPPLAGASCGR